MIEGSIPKEVNRQADMAAILKSVQEVSINGKFPKGASFQRCLQGEPPVLMVIPRQPGDEYTRGAGSFGKINLINSGIAPIIDGIESGVLHQGDNLPSSLAYDTQFLTVDTINPPQRMTEDQTNRHAIVSYRFLQAGSSPDRRPLLGVSVRAVVPQEQASRLVELLKQDPDAIETFYSGVAGGLEDHVQRVRSDRLAVLDLRNITQEDIRRKFADSGRPLKGLLLQWYEATGQIPRLYYKSDTHGTVGTTEKYTRDDKYPIIDVKVQSAIEKRILAYR